MFMKFNGLMIIHWVVILIYPCVPCLSGTSCPSHMNSRNSLLHCICLIQHLAFQTDVDYTTLHDYTDGLPTWPTQTMCIGDDSQVLLWLITLHQALSLSSKPSHAWSIMYLMAPMLQTLTFMMSLRYAKLCNWCSICSIGYRPWSLPYLHQGKTPQSCSWPEHFKAGNTMFSRNFHWLWFHGSTFI